MLFKNKPVVSNDLLKALVDIWVHIELVLETVGIQILELVNLSAIKGGKAWLLEQVWVVLSLN